MDGQYQGIVRYETEESHTLQRVDLPCQFTDRKYWIRLDTRNCPELEKKEWREEDERDRATVMILVQFTPGQVF